MILDNQIDDHLNESNTSDDESVASSIEDIEDNNKEETQVFIKKVSGLPSQTRQKDSPSKEEIK